MKPQKILQFLSRLELAVVQRLSTNESECFCRYGQHPVSDPRCQMRCTEETTLTVLVDTWTCSCPSIADNFQSYSRIHLRVLFQAKCPKVRILLVLIPFRRPRHSATASSLPLGRHLTPRPTSTHLFAAGIPTILRLCNTCLRWIALYV